MKKSVFRLKLNNFFHYNPEKQLFMKKNNYQFINFILIIGGGGIIIFQTARENNDHPYLLIVGLVMLMYGLYRATNHWVVTKDDEHDDDKLEKED